MRESRARCGLRAAAAAWASASVGPSRVSKDAGAPESRDAPELNCIGFAVWPSLILSESESGGATILSAKVSEGESFPQSPEAANTAKSESKHVFMRRRGDDQDDNRTQRMFQSSNRRH